MRKEIIKYALPELKFNIADCDSVNNPVWTDSHFHSAIELAYVTEGEIFAEIDGEKINALKNDIILINRNVIHRLSYTSYAAITFIQIEFSANESPKESLKDTNLYNFAVKKNDVKYRLFDEGTELGEFFKEIRKEMSEKNSHYEMSVKAYMDLIAVFMLRNNIISEFTKGDLEKIQHFLPMAKYVEENYSDSLTLESLAKLIGYTKFELCRKFKSATGRTVIDYVNYVRLCYAKSFLESDEKNITEIALSCGFSSIQYFNKIFKKYNGISPKKYKTAQNERNIW